MGLIAVAIFSTSSYILALGALIGIVLLILMFIELTKKAIALKSYRANRTKDQKSKGGMVFSTWAHITIASVLGIFIPLLVIGIIVGFS